MAAHKDHSRTPLTVSPGSGLRVVLLISNLEYGGAQRQVVELANCMNAVGHEAHVCSLSDYVPLAVDLNDADRRLHVVTKRAKYDVTVVVRVARLLRRLRADLVHAFLFDAQMAARLAGCLSHGVAVIGSERNSDYQVKPVHRFTYLLTRRCFDAIIANSHAGKRFQEREFGVSAGRLFVVHNGVDATRFRRKSSEHLRGELDIPHGSPVVGMFSSFKVQKNHAMLFRAAQRLLLQRPDARFICVGDELHGGLQASDQYRREMSQMVESLGLSAAFRFLGNRGDVVDLYNLCQVTVLTSRREGTPNVVLESMSCGVPVVATNVADNAIIIRDGETGFVVPYDDDEAMADRVMELLSDPTKREMLSRNGRSWVEQEFSIAALMSKTLGVYEEVIRRRRGRGRA